MKKSIFYWPYMASISGERKPEKKNPENYFFEVIVAAPNFQKARQLHNKVFAGGNGIMWFDHYTNSRKYVQNKSNDEKFIDFVDQFPFDEIIAVKLSSENTWKLIHMN